MPQREFYPRHFQRTRPYAKDLSDRISKLSNEKRLSVAAATNEAFEAVTSAYVQQNITPQQADFLLNVTRESQAALAYQEWQHQGAALYTFAPELLKALSLSDTGSVSLNDLHTPFQAVYFDFGDLELPVLHTCAPVTGAYLMYSPQQYCRLSLTAALPAGIPWTSRAAEIYDLRISREFFTLALKDAIDQALAEDILDIEKALQQSGTANSLATGQAMIAAHAQNKPAYSAALSLIFNSLCYLNTYRTDCHLEWQKNTPDKLKKQTASAQKKEAANAQSKLNGLGYRKVFYVGHDFEAAATLDTPSGIAPHWRRGHWRNQPYGEGSILRKLIWLRPTRVLGGAVPPDARVYEVKDAG